MSELQGRPSWDEVWMAAALNIADRSSCLRPNAKMAVVFTTADFELICTGVVGAPRGLPNCREVGCLIIEGHCRRTVHAEINGIIQATRSARSLVGATAYVTARPCILCTNAMLQAGVRRIVYFREYDTDNARVHVEAMTAALGVSLERFPR